MLRLLSKRSVLNGNKSMLSLILKKHKVTMGDPIEHATGLEKRELLAKAAGDKNPFQLYVLKREAGTEDCPNEVPSALDHRIVGCICEKDSTVINYMWLTGEDPKRCECGYWFKLVPMTPL